MLLCGNGTGDILRGPFYKGRDSDAHNGTLK